MLTYQEWFEKARQKAPFLHIGISAEDIWKAAFEAGRDDAVDEIKRMRDGYLILRDCSDSEMMDGDLAREIARKMLGPNVK